MSLLLAKLHITEVITYIALGTYVILSLHMQQWNRPTARGAKENNWRCEEEAFCENHCSKGQG